MAKEIERKFLVDLDKFERPDTFKSIKQGYIPRGNKTTVRVRVSDKKAYLTLKGMTTGYSRDEFEYEIPVQDVEEMLNSMCDSRLIEKKRYEITLDNHLWEVDFFDGDNEGLVVAEIELTTEDEKFERPIWLGNEVTYEDKYYNAILMHSPYKTW